MNNLYEQKMQIECNGKNKCRNEIDLRSVLFEHVSTSSGDQFMSGINMPLRVILKCKHCKDGRVIVTGEMFWNQHFEAVAE